MSDPRREIAQRSVKDFLELLEGANAGSQQFRPGRVRRLGPTDKRVETGVVRFGDDWPGVFVRGDDAARLWLDLRTLIEEEPTP